MLAMTYDNTSARVLMKHAEDHTANSRGSAWRPFQPRLPQRQLGRGTLELSHVNGRTEVTQAQAVNPLKLLCPRGRDAAARIYTSTYGGGLVAGDEIDLHVRLGARTTCVLSTQSSTKIYKNPCRLPCRQRMQATIAADALLVVAPDPITCFAEAAYEQQQRFDVDLNGSLVVIDWLTSGRRARGECWAFTRYRSRLDVFLGGRHLLADSLLLDPDDGPLDAPHCMGRFHCLALAVVVGQRLQAPADQLLDRVGRQGIQRGSSLIAAASPIAHGAILRVLGTTTQQVAQYLRDRLCFLGPLLGESMWARKW